MTAPTPSLPVRSGLYFEDFQVGQTAVSAGRTITEADVVAFAGLTGDWTGIHTDAVYASTHPMGKRFAHGMLGASIASGLAIRMGFMEGTVLAMREIESWKFSHPIFLGDTVHVEVKIIKTQAIPRLKAGMVSFEVDLINQDGKIVQHGVWKV
jgi:acyl dehydratase